MSSPFLANSGISLFAFYIPAMLWLLPGVVLWEVLAARKILAHSWGRTITAISIANISSTAVGFALWIICHYVAIGVALSMGRGPLSASLANGLEFSPRNFNPWTASLLVLIFLWISLLTSVRLESWIVSRFFRQETAERVSAFSWRVHLPAYAVFVGLWFALVREIIVTAFD